MTSILKGDTSSEIPVVLAEGYDYEGATVHVDFLGVRRSFTNVRAGDSLPLRFQHAETALFPLGAWPVRVQIVKNGMVVTVRDGGVKLHVTDDPSEVYTDGVIAVDAHGSLYGLTGLPERYTDEDVRDKINEILRRGGATVAVLALCALSAFGASVQVQTAPKGRIFNDERVVTNVTFDVSDLADTNDVAEAVAEANAYADRKIGEIPAPDFSVSNDTLRATIKATAPAPGNYANVSNAAMNAVQPQSMTNFYTKAETEEKIAEFMPMPDRITSTNMTLSTGRPGTTTLNADLSITEMPDPAYSVTTNELPYIPNVITARTTRASEDLLSYAYEGIVNGAHSWKTSLPADRWTSVWYGEACPSGITYSASAHCWYLYTGSGQQVEMPAADFPPEKVMLGEVPLVGSYRMGLSTKVWTAAPQTWTDIQGGEYSDDFPHYETNHFSVVRTRAVRRDEVPDWALAETKPTYTPQEVGALPASAYLTTSRWFSGSGISFFGVGEPGQNAGLNTDGYLEATEPGGMASDWVPLVYNTQYKTQGIRYRRYRTSTGTNETFDVTLSFPQEGGTLTTREWTGGEIGKATNDFAGAIAPQLSAAAEAGEKAEQALTYSFANYQFNHASTNAWFEGTNFNVNAEQATNKVKYVAEPWEDVLYTPCSLQLLEIRDGQKQVVWDQRDWTVYYWNFKSAQMSNNLANAMHGLSEDVRTNYMARGFAKYTAVQGLDNPDPSTLWIDTPKVQLMAGHQWEKLVEVGGAGYWTLTGNGVELSSNDATNTFLTIKDFEGNACLTFRKTSSYLVYCQAGSDIQQQYWDLQGRVVFPLTTDVKPVAEFSTVLENASFVAEDDENCPVNYEWTGSAGAWECHFLLKPGIASNSCFARFKVMREGENVVEHTVPIKLNGGLVFEQGGQTYKIAPSVNNGTVTWSVVQ